MNGYAWSGKVVSICWILFMIVWVIASFSTKRTIQHEGAHDYRRRLARS